MSARRQGQLLQVSVADNGEASRDDPAADIERFYRVDRSRRPETGGADLGLTIAKRLWKRTRRHRG